MASYEDGQRVMWNHYSHLLQAAEKPIHTMDWPNEPWNQNGKYRCYEPKTFAICLSGVTYAGENKCLCGRIWFCRCRPRADSSFGPKAMALRPPAGSISSERSELDLVSLEPEITMTDLLQHGFRQQCSMPLSADYGCRRERSTQTNVRIWIAGAIPKAFHADCLAITDGQRTWLASFAAGRMLSGIKRVWSRREVLRRAMCHVW